MGDNQIKLKRAIYDEMLSLIEEELYQRVNDQQNNQQYKAAAGGATENPEFTFRADGKIMPGKFEVVRNSLKLTLPDALKATYTRQQNFSRHLV